jgi:hypothetical protein
MQANKLSGRVEAIVEAITEQSQPVTNKPERRDLVILLILLLAQVSCFLPICFKVGFYLDDWHTFLNLHFAPHNLFDLLKASFADPRIVIRPLQCFYFAITYFFFGDRPLGYHLLRFAIEYAGAASLYLGVKRLSLSRFVAALTALIFILNPSHDATHYWIGGGLGPSLGLTLFLISFSLSIYAFTSKNKLLYGLALTFYGLSAFSYESLLPMLVMSFCAVLLLSAENRTESRLNTMGSVVWCFVPFLAVACLSPIYQHVLLPRFAHAALPPSSFNPGYFFNVFVQGLNMSCFAGLWSFLAERVREEIISFRLVQTLQMLGVTVATVALILVSYADDQCIRYRRLFTAAILTFFASYLTFAVAQGYTPVLDSMFNRVNTGASVAVSLFVALGIKWLIDHTRLKAKTALAVSMAICLPFVLVMVFANLALAAFWIRSWEVQKDVRYLVQQHAGQISEADSILLAGTHRYLNWAPVYDGTWDFQSMLRMTLNKKLLSGGVICDRLSIKGGSIQDNSAGYLSTDYPVEKITVLFPSQSAWVPVRTCQDFIKLAAERQHEFGISAQTLKRWKVEASQSEPAAN